MKNLAHTACIVHAQFMHSSYVETSNNAELRVAVVVLLLAVALVIISDVDIRDVECVFDRGLSSIVLTF